MVIEYLNSLVNKVVTIVKLETLVRFPRPFYLNSIP